MQPIKLKNMEIVNILNNLNSDQGFLRSNDQDKKLPVGLLFAISKNAKKLEEIRTVIEEQEKAINAEYFNEEKSDKREDGSMEIKPEFRSEFIQKKNELFEIENEIDIDTINVNDISVISLTPSDFQSISFMLTDE